MMENNSSCYENMMRLHRWCEENQRYETLEEHNSHAKDKPVEYDKSKEIFYAYAFGVISTVIVVWFATKVLGW